MFFELIAVFVAGFAGAGAAMILRKVTGGRLPRWLVPVGAGAAMLAATISSEYTWYARTAAALPEDMQVAQTVESRAAWRPWTYVFPLTDRFVAVDVGGLRANQQTTDLYLAEMAFFARWRPVTQVQIMVDCAGNRRADPTMGDGSDPVWRDVGPQDPVVQTVCAEA